MATPLAEGPFLGQTTERERGINPFLPLVLGAVLSASVLAHHFFSIKNHLHHAEQKLDKHLHQLRFAEEFNRLDELMGNAARMAMQGSDRMLLAQYLEHESSMKVLLDQRFKEEQADPEAQRILLELRKTFRDLIQLEATHSLEKEIPYFMTTEYVVARDSIRKLLRDLNQRILIASDGPEKSLKLLNNELDRKNQIVVLGLLFFWAGLITWVLWLRGLHVRTRNESKRQKNTLEALVQHMPNGVVAVDREGRFTLWNRAAQDMLEGGPTLLPHYLWERANGLKDEVWLHSNGSKRSFRVNGAHLRDENNNVMGAMLVFEEITERIRLEKELNNQRQKKAHAAKMATLGEVAGNLAHEINTPLGTVELSLGGMRDALKSENQKAVEAYIDCISQATRRMSSIVKAFRRYSRLDSDTEEKEVIDLREVGHDVLEICGPDLNGRGVKLEKNFPRKRLLVECRPGSLSQAMINLISNARDATKGEHESWVSLSLKEEGHDVVIQVVDSGKGIDWNIRDQIFEPFFTTKGRGEGSGIGLGIVRDVARAHGGDVHLKNINGNTCFEIRFPSFIEQTSAA